MNISLITPAPWNTRTAITDESVRSLAASMEADGLIQPISVIRDGDGYICYDGNRRLAAARLLGWTEIAANVDDVTLDEAKVRTVTANIQREADDPLLAAGVVKALLDDGADAGEIAAKLGKSVAWVNRRRKMIGASEALKGAADKVTVEALERVAVLPEAVQGRVVKEIERMASYMGKVGVRDIGGLIGREMRDLDEAPFSTDPCAKCPKRTGAEADLFGVADDGLGKCLDCKCYETMTKAWADAEIKKLVGDAEVVRVAYAWQLPGDDESGDKRTRKHPCAYVCVNGNRIDVRWGESSEAKAKREAEEQRKADAERKAEQEKRNATRGITDRLYAYASKRTNEGAIAEIVRRAVESGDENAVGYAVEQAVRAISSWNTDLEWANIVRTFPEVATAAQVDKGEAEYLSREFPETDGEEADE